MAVGSRRGQRRRIQFRLDVRRSERRFAGGTIGYNYQPVGTPFVLGIEIDAAWAISRRRARRLRSASSRRSKTRSNAIGSATGRIGYAWGPGLLYAKGGYAWADNRVTASLTARGSRSRRRKSLPFRLDRRRRRGVPVRAALVGQDRVHVRRLRQFHLRRKVSFRAALTQRHGSHIQGRHQLSLRLGRQPGRGAVLMAR